MGLDEAPLAYSKGKRHQVSNPTASEKVTKAAAVDTIRAKKGTVMMNIFSTGRVSLHRHQIMERSEIHDSVPAMSA